MDMSQQRVWFITGASQGFGRELCHVALRRGDKVVATSRDADRATAQLGGPQDRLLVLPMTPADESSVSRAVDAAIAWAGTIDVLVNNAGYGMIGAVEEASDAEVREIFEVSVFGLLRLIRAVLPHMRARRQGHIVNLSSVGGLSGNTGFGIYNATKFAVEGLSEAMAQDLAPLGVRVLIVEPGPFRTNFLGSSMALAQREIPNYAPTSGEARRARLARHGNQPGDPVRGAEAIVAAVCSDNPPLHLVLGTAAYERTMRKLTSLQRDMEVWKSVSESTEIDTSTSPL